MKLKGKVPIRLLPRERESLIKQGVIRMPPPKPSTYPRYRKYPTHQAFCEARLKYRRQWMRDWRAKQKKAAIERHEADEEIALHLVRSGY